MFLRIREGGHERQLELTLPSGGEGSRGGADCVLVLPGGGYAVHAPHEAEPVVRWANGLGLAGAVLRYAVVGMEGWGGEGGGGGEFVMRGPLLEQPLRDCLDAVRTLRARKEELGLAGRIVVLGFSAGGHLAATLSTHGCHDPATRVEGSILVYPVITMLEATHGGSRDNLLGKDAPKHLCELFSNELRVTEKTPPAFVVHGWDDSAVKVENALAYCGALRSKGIPFELHVYPKGEHGFGMGEGAWSKAPVGAWPQLAGVWVRELLARR